MRYAGEGPGRRRNPRQLFTRLRAPAQQLKLQTLFTAFIVQL